MTTSQRVILFLLVVSLFFGAATGSRLFFQLTYIWFFIYIGSWIWARLALRGVLLERSARTLRAQVGQIFEERFELENPGRLMRIWIEVRNLSPLPGPGGSRLLTLIDGGQGRSYLARTRLMQRGVFPLGPTVLASGDLFGLFPVEVTLPAKAELMVYPYMVDVTNFPNLPGLLPGGEALSRRTHQITPNAAGVREYVHGDPLSRIHWLSSARRNQLMVKEFELDPLADVWIFLDAARGVQASLPQPPQDFRLLDVLQRNYKVTLQPSTEEYGISAAASLAREGLRRGRAVGLAAAGQQLTLLAPDRGGRQLGKILEALSLLRAQGYMPLRGLVEAQVKHIPRGSTVVLITPMLSKDLTVLADFLMRRGLRLVVVLLDAASFGGYRGSADLVVQLKAMGVSVRYIACGDDIAFRLSTEM